MTSPRPAGTSRLLLAAVVAAGLALGGLAFVLSGRASDPSTIDPLPPDALGTTSAPSPRGSGPSAPLATQRPPEAVAVPGKTFYAVFLAVATDAADPALLAAQRRAARLGYNGGIGDLTCTTGAREQLGLPTQGRYSAYSILFATAQDVSDFRRLTAAELPAKDVVGTARVTVQCTD